MPECFCAQPKTKTVCTALAPRRDARIHVFLVVLCIPPKAIAMVVGASKIVRNPEDLGIFSRRKDSSGSQKVIGSNPLSSTST